MKKIKQQSNGALHFIEEKIIRYATILAITIVLLFTSISASAQSADSIKWKTAFVETSPRKAILDLSLLQKYFTLTIKKNSNSDFESLSNITISIVVSRFTDGKHETTILTKKLFERQTVDFIEGQAMLEDNEVTGSSKKGYQLGQIDFLPPMEPGLVFITVVLECSNPGIVIFSNKAEFEIK